MMPEGIDLRARATNALVVFTGQTDLKWLHLLKPGFRHCFAIIGDGFDWVLINPLSHQTDLVMFQGVSAREFETAFFRGRLPGCREPNP